MKIKLALLAASFVILGGCSPITNQKATMEKTSPQGPTPVQRSFPSSGSTLRDTTKIPGDFSITYRYRGGSYQGSGEYTISLKVKGEGTLSFGDRTESFSVSNEALEGIFHAMVQKKVFNAEPWAIVRWQDYLGRIFGIGGSHVSLKVVADQTTTEFPALPGTVRKNNINLDQVLRVQGIPKGLTRSALEGMVAEADSLSEIFASIDALVPDNVRAKMGQ